jgi:hypothetical protein
MDHRQPAPPEPRPFGITFAVVFAVAAVIAWMKQAPDGAAGLAVAALMFLGLGLARASLLRPLARGWHRFGLILHRITTPVLLTIIYFVVMVPTGVLRRLIRRDPLALRLDPTAESYWILRDPPGPRPETMRKPF